MNYRAAPDAPLIVATTKVQAFDRATGKQLWVYELEGVTRRFAFDEQRVFVFESTGVLHCLEIKTGRLIGSVHSGLMSGSNMLVDGDRIYLTSDNHVTALDPQGKVLWTASIVNGAHSLGGLGIPGGPIVQPDYADGR